jgi:hypothetical protein
MMCRLLAVLAVVLLTISFVASTNVNVKVHVDLGSEPKAVVPKSIAVAPIPVSGAEVDELPGPEADFNEEEAINEFQRASRKLIVGASLNPGCDAQGGTCRVGCTTGGRVQSGLCRGGSNVKCCIPAGGNNGGNNGGSSGDNDSPAVKAALAYFDAHQSQFPNKRYVSAVDFNLPANRKRFYLIDMSNRHVVETHQTSHGRGSDPRNSGMATLFSNVNGSFKSSLGAYKTNDSTYFWPKHPPVALRLHGLQPTNSNALSRGILVHTATYVLDNGVRSGRSEGCFVLPLSVVASIINKIKGGSLLYAHK